MTRIRCDVEEFTIAPSTPTGTILARDCFVFPEEWDEESKCQYTAWLSRQSEMHPAKADPEPWKQ